MRACWAAFGHKEIDEVFVFLLVWAYCTSAVYTMNIRCVCVFMHAMLACVICMLQGRSPPPWWRSGKDESHIALFMCLYDAFELHTWWRAVRGWWKGGEVGLRGCGAGVRFLPMSWLVLVWGGCQNQCIPHKWSCGHAERHRGFQAAHETVFDPGWESINSPDSHRRYQPINTCSQHSSGWLSRAQTRVENNTRKSAG